MEFIKAFDKDVYNHPVVYDGDPLTKGPSITYTGKMYIGIDFGKEINELQQNQFNRGKSREIFNKFKKNTGSPIELYNGKDVLQSLVKQFGVKFSKETLNDTKYFDLAGNVDKSHDEYDYLQFNNFNEALKVLQEANKMVTTINDLKKPESEKCGLMAIEFGNTKLFKTISESAKN